MNRADIQSSANDRNLVLANYTKLSENIRRLTPQGIQCSVFCGGTNCKYESPENWTADSLALQGIYSHWITDDILAMARPSTAIIIKKNIIQQFQSLGIKSIINLQCPKEHASCGEPLEDSGFSYDPSLFMENNIYYYNFAWRDYGDATLSELLNMVKVLAFAVTEGRVAIHCHAGLGRTGVLIACYLVYSLRVPANESIKYVRLRRPGSVQTRGQIICVRHFAQFILPQSVTYYIKDPKDKYMTEFTLQKFLKRQKIVLHGYEERNFKFLPKIVHVICERILQLCGCYNEEFSSKTTSITNDFLYNKLNENIHRHESIYSISSAFSGSTSPSPDTIKIPSCDSSYTVSSLSVSPSPTEGEDQPDSSPLSDSYSDISTLSGDEGTQEYLLSENKCFQELETQKMHPDNYIPEELSDISEVVTALLTDFEDFGLEIKETILKYQNDINVSQSGWIQLKSETNSIILAALLFEWLEGLKAPVLGRDSLEAIVIYYKQPETCFKKFPLEEAYLIEYLLNFVSKLNLPTEEDTHNVLMRFVASLAQQVIVINDKLLPSGRRFNKLREGTLNCTNQFFKSLLPIIKIYHEQQLQKLALNSPNDDENTEDYENTNTDCGFLE